MKPKNMILLVVAVGCGLVASYMTSQLLANRQAPKTTVKILVAKKKIPNFTLLKEPEAWFVEKVVDEENAPKKAITNWADLKDKRTAAVIFEENYVIAEQLLDPKVNGLEAQMKQGERAIAIKVNAESLAGGFILPGSHVDVISTVRGGGESESKTIMQNMLVLAIDMQASKDPERPTMLGQTVTLSVKSEEAQRLSVAAQNGELRLTLRPAGDVDTVNLRPSKMGDLLKPTGEQTKEEEAPQVPHVLIVPKLNEVKDVEETPAEMTEVVAAPPPPVEKIERHTLTIVNGDVVQKTVFTRKEGTESWDNGSSSSRADEVVPPPAPAAQPAKVVPPPSPPADNGAQKKAPGSRSSSR